MRLVILIAFASAISGTLPARASDASDEISEQETKVETHDTAGDKAESKGTTMASVPESTAGDQETVAAVDKVIEQMEGKATEQKAIEPSPLLVMWSWLTAIPTAVSAVLAVLLTYSLARSADRKRRDESIRSHIDALGMEVRYCGELAATYLSQPVKSPLYRLPTTAYSTAIPLLLSEGLIAGDQFESLQKFYLQVDQVNRGLDNVDGFLRGRLTPPKDGITLEDELSRLRAKANEMRKQGSGDGKSQMFAQAEQAYFDLFHAWTQRRSTLVARILRSPRRWIARVWSKVR